jgi:hypothetical protein
MCPLTASRDQRVDEDRVARLQGSPKQPVLQHLASKGLFLALCVATLAAFTLRSQDPGPYVLTCGDATVRLMRLQGQRAEVLWSWTATNSNLPQEVWPKFVTTDEVKYAPGGRLVITSSGGDTLDGAVAVVEMWSTNVLFHASAPNAHSADFLPGQRIAVAMSYHSRGDRMAVFDLSSGQEILSVPLFGGHGVVWDEQRQLLWALADPYLAAFVLTNWFTANPRLVEVYRLWLLDINGHDLYPVPGTSHLLLTTANAVWLFDRDTRTLVRHPRLGTAKHVKGVSVHPITGQTVYVQGDISWWSESLRFLDPDQTLRFPGIRFYKARWFLWDAPQLKAQLTPTNTVLLRWPASWTGFQMQRRNAHGTWEPAPWEVRSDDAHFYMIAPAEDSGAWFRLWKPMR